MSASMLRKALKTFGDEEKKKSNVSRAKTNNDTSIKKPQFKKPRQRQPTMKDKRFRSAIEEYKQKKSNDMTKANVRLLKSIGRRRLMHQDKLKNIMKHQRGRLSKNNPTKKKPKTDNNTVFTEADFQNFEKHYFKKK